MYYYLIVIDIIYIYILPYLYAHIFIMKPNTVRILFHSTKVCITNLKCVFNRSSLSYQLFSNINSVPIDGQSDSYNNSTNEFEKWS